jgi:hypothetical protein
MPRATSVWWARKSLSFCAARGGLLPAWPRQTGPHWPHLLHQWRRWPPVFPWASARCCAANPRRTGVCWPPAPRARHRGLGRQHARQVGCTPGTGDDGAQALGRRRLGVGKHVIGHAVGRNHPRFVADAKLLENLHCMLHGVPVGAGAHDDADLNVMLLKCHPPIFTFTFSPPT